MSDEGFVTDLTYGNEIEKEKNYKTSPKHVSSNSKHDSSNSKHPKNHKPMNLVVVLSQSEDKKDLFLELHCNGIKDVEIKSLIGCKVIEIYCKICHNSVDNIEFDKPGPFILNDEEYRWRKELPFHVGKPFLVEFCPNFQKWNLDRQLKYALTSIRPKAQVKRNQIFNKKKNITISTKVGSSNLINVPIDAEKNERKMGPPFHLFCAENRHLPYSKLEEKWYCLEPSVCFSLLFFFEIF